MLTSKQVFLLLGSWLLGLSAFAQNKLLLSDARVAPDGQRFVFSASTGAGFRVYEQAFAGADRAEAVSPVAAGFHCFGPAYSPDGRYILYLQEPTSARRPDYADLLLYDRQTRATQVLTTGKQLIKQALFSFDGQRILYIVADFYGHYSPVAPKAAHELDIYSMRLDGTQAHRISFLTAYALGNLTPLRAPDRYLVNVNEPRKHLSGTYAYTLSDSTQLQFVPDSVATANQLTYLPDVWASRRMQVPYTIGNSLYVKSMRSGRSSLLYTGAASPLAMAFVATQPLLLFSERGASPTSFGVFNFKLLNLDTLTTTPVVLRLD